MYHPCRSRGLVSRWGTGEPELFWHVPPCRSRASLPLGDRRGGHVKFPSRAFWHLVFFWQGPVQHVVLLLGALLQIAENIGLVRRRQLAVGGRR
jgi:hypothetical protein